MKHYLVIDGGTTNTRVGLIQNGAVIDVTKINVGARANMQEKGLLESKLKSAIQDLLSRNHLEEKSIHRILASGMITSEFGLCHLEHLCTPASIDELHAGMHETHLPDICSIPFVFLRGVKTASDDFTKVDIMRGEETELMGLASIGNESCIYILPGSHSKIIQMDAEGKISDFCTMMSGEMIYALSQHTILRDAVDLSISECDHDYLLRGYDFCHQVGVNQALFKTRILKNIFRATPEQVYSYFLGVVLADEIDRILASDAQTVVIGGKSQIKTAMYILLTHRSKKCVRILSDEAVENSVFLGARRIFEYSCH